MMKRLTIAVCMLGCAAMALASGNAALTGGSRPGATPGVFCDFDEQPLFQLGPNGEWIALPVGDIGNRARAWSFEIGYQDSCNKINWPVTLKSEAAVAQWMIISMDKDGFHWAVRKPGDYVTGTVNLTCRSNYAIEVSCSGFEDLLSQDDRAIDSVIEVKYAFDNQGEVPPALEDSMWYTPAQLNEMTWMIDDSYQLHWDGWTQHIWSTIHVGACNGPFNYVDPDWATITCSLTEQQPWIDPETGLFDGMPAFPFQS